MELFYIAMLILFRTCEMVQKLVSFMSTWVKILEDVIVYMIDFVKSILDMLT